MEFLASRYRNLWVDDYNLEIYLRKGERYLRPNPHGHIVKFSTFEIANIISLKPGNGNFTNYLNYLNKTITKDNFDCIFIENIMDSRFVKFLKRNNFKIIYPLGSYKNTYPNAVKYLIEI